MRRPPLSRCLVSANLARANERPRERRTNGRGGEGKERRRAAVCERARAHERTHSLGRLPPPEPGTTRLLYPSRSARTFPKLASWSTCRHGSPERLRPDPQASPSPSPPTPPHAPRVETCGSSEPFSALALALARPPTFALACALVMRRDGIASQALPSNETIGDRRDVETESIISQ